MTNFDDALKNAIAQIPLEIQEFVHTLIKSLTEIYGKPTLISDVNHLEATWRIGTCIVTLNVSDDDTFWQVYKDPQTYYSQEFTRESSVEYIIQEIDYFLFNNVTSYKGQTAERAKISNLSETEVTFTTRSGTISFNINQEQYATLQGCESVDISFRYQHFHRGRKGLDLLEIRKVEKYSPEETLRMWREWGESVGAHFCDDEENCSICAKMMNSTVQEESESK